MECPECGAEIESDSKFCARCAAPVAPIGAALDDVDGVDGDDDDRDELDDDDEVGDEHFVDGDHVDVADDHASAARAAPAGAPGQGAKVVGVVLGLATLILGIVRLTNRPSVRFEVIEPPDLGSSARVAETSRPTVLRGAPPDRAPTDSERALAGTWVATVGFDAPRPASMGSTLVQLQALRSGLSAPLTRCVWLELYDNLRGFQHECGVVDSEPSALEQTDPLTGRRSPLGAAFRWGFDGGRLSITYDEEMTVTAGGRPTRFVETVLTLPQGSPPFDVQQSFPEHPDVPPLAVRFDVFAGSYLGDEPAQ